MGEADLSIISKGVVKAHTGQNIVFRCIGVSGVFSTSDGYVSHTKIHFKRNQQIVDSSKQRSNSLTVSASAENTGTVYQCEAENSYGKSLSNEIGIEILCKSFEQHVSNANFNYISVYQLLLLLALGCLKVYLLMFLSCLTNH